MTPNKFRWGILSTAQIARKNWKAIRNSGNATVAAVASRSLARSRAFIAECQGEVPMETPPQALGSYAELIASPEIDGVYIPLPTGLRKEWVLRAAEAGKHVICEKPCAVSVADLNEMLEACRKHHVQFMDGVMFMHSDRLPAIRKVLDDNKSIGPIQRITSAFSFRGPGDFLATNIRAQNVLEPFGCLGDLGWYCIRFALWVMREALPERVVGRVLNTAGGGKIGAAVPTEFSGELFFPNDVSSSFYCSFLTHNEQWARISGQLGSLQLNDFVLPYFGSATSFALNQAQFEVHGCDFNMEPHGRRVTVPEYSNSHANAQETKLFRNFVEQVQRRQLNDAWEKMALKTQQVMQACYDSARAESRLTEVTQ